MPKLKIYGAPADQEACLAVQEIDDSVDRIVAGMEGTPMVDGKSKSLGEHHFGIGVLESLPPGFSCSPTCQADQASH